MMVIIEVTFGVMLTCQCFWDQHGLKCAAIRTHRGGSQALMETIRLVENSEHP